MVAMPAQYGRWTSGDTPIDREEPAPQMLFPQEVHLQWGSCWLIHDTAMSVLGSRRDVRDDLGCGRSSPSSRPQNRVCHVHAACRLAGAGSADRGGDRGEVPG